MPHYVLVIQRDRTPRTGIPGTMGADLAWVYDLGRTSVTDDLVRDIRDLWLKHQCDWTSARLLVDPAMAPGLDAHGEVQMIPEASLMDLIEQWSAEIDRKAVIEECTPNAKGSGKKQTVLGYERSRSVELRRLKSFDRCITAGNQVLTFLRLMSGTPGYYFCRDELGNDITVNGKTKVCVFDSDLCGIAYEDWSEGDMVLRHCTGQNAEKHEHSDDVNTWHGRPWNEAREQRAADMEERDDLMARHPEIARLVQLMGKYPGPVVW